jgi:hypothetical protein
MIDANDAKRISWSFKHQKAVNEIDIKIVTAAGEGKTAIECMIPNNYCQKDCDELLDYLVDKKGYNVKTYSENAHRLLIMW